MPRSTFVPNQLKLSYLNKIVAHVLFPHITSFVKEQVLLQYLVKSSETNPIEVRSRFTIPWKQLKSLTDHIQQIFCLKYIVRLANVLFKLLVLGQWWYAYCLCDLVMLGFIIIGFYLCRILYDLTILASDTVTNMCSFVYIIARQNRAIPRVAGTVLNFVALLFLRAAIRLRFVGRTCVARVYLP